MTGTKFRQQITAIVDSYIGLKDQLTKEKVALGKLWKNREHTIDDAIAMTVALQGELQAIGGKEFDIVSEPELGLAAQS